MRFIQITFFVALVGIVFACSDQPQHSSITTLTTAAFEEMIQKDVILLDVRTPDEFNEGHLENALAMDYYNDDFEKRLMELPKGKAIYVYCQAGSRSSSASKIIADQGHTQVYNLLGGINAWESSGLPIVSN
ncbi:MAG: rhodanese-like domain-containing protein [Flavobacteriales bacterium]|nr:rhodanese-like domain-containing protein [Flavobacteriales bacterium]